MGIGPAPAIRQLLKKTGRALKDVDVIEVRRARAGVARSVGGNGNGLDSKLTCVPSL